MENLVYKNELNSYCRRINIPLPVYNTRFACTVSVGGKTFTSSSSSTFTNRISAEQDAAKLALQHLLYEDASRTTTNLRLYLRKLVCHDKTRCKMILNEFIHKMKMECAYETVQVEKAHVFVSSLVLNGTCYKGECGKNKKEAEQLAAFAAILSLLDDPTYATQIYEVMKSKFSACAVFNVLKDCSVTSNEFKSTTSNGCNVIPLTQQQSSFRVVVDDQKPATSVELHGNSIGERGGSGILFRENKQVFGNSLPQLENQVNKTSLPQTEKLGILDDTQCVSGHHLPGAVTISRCSYVPLPITSPLVSEPQHEIKLPEATHLSSKQIGVLPERVLVPAAAAHGPGYDSISSRKRPKSKKKKKANKRLPRTPLLFSEPQPVIMLQEATKPASQQTRFPTEFVPVPAAPAVHKPGKDSISSETRRRKNKQKANKRRRVGEQAYRGH